MRTRQGALACKPATAAVATRYMSDCDAWRRERRRGAERASEGTVSAEPFFFEVHFWAMF